MPNNPQRPTENEALLRLPFYEASTTEPSYTRGNPGETVRVYQGERPQFVMIMNDNRMPLWFDPDEEIEIEAPEDEAPESE